jgi:hypothetical protein
MRAAARPRNLVLSLVLISPGDLRAWVARGLQLWRRAAGLVPNWDDPGPEIVMKLAASRELYAYWDGLRGARSAPERNDVEPGAIRGVLADTFILEFDPARGFPLRIVGTRTSALFLSELRGKPFLGLWRQSERAEIATILTALADEAQPFLIGASAAPTGFPPIEVELLLLPLRHHGDTHARALGCCAPRGAPAWLGLAGVEAMTLLTLRALGAHELGDDSGHQPPRADGFARPARSIRRGHLYLLAPGR